MSDFYRFLDGEKNEKQIICVSQRRVPLEPKKSKYVELVDLRRNFKNRIANLKSNSSEILYTEFNTKDEGRFDVENILFYSIGQGEFKKICKNGLIFNYPSIQYENEDYLNEYTYKITEKNKINSKINDFINSGKILYKFPLSLERLYTKWNFLNYWILIKKENVEVIEKKKADETPYLGIDVSVGDGVKVVNFSSAMKGLIDGIFVSMHHEISINREILKLLASKSGVTENKLKNWLENDGSSILGKKEKLIHKHGKGIKCNPKDELCRFFRIIRKENSDKNDMSIVVTVYEFDKIESLL